jgi:hypothetical protein
MCGMKINEERQTASKDVIAAKALFITERSNILFAVFCDYKKPQTTKWREISLR